MKKSRFEGSPGLHRPAHPPLCLSACLPPPPHSFPISPFLSFTVSLISNSYNVSLICVLHLFPCISFQTSLFSTSLSLCASFTAHISLYLFLCFSFSLSHSLHLFLIIHIFLCILQYCTSYSYKELPFSVSLFFLFLCIFLPITFSSVSFLGISFLF